MTSCPLALAAFAASLVLAGCATSETDPEAAGSDPPSAAATPSPSTDVATATTLPEELQRSWLIRLRHDDIRDQLTAAGFGRYQDRFFGAEKLTEPALLVLTYEADSFSIAFFQRDRTWKVGWWGQADVVDDVITMHDDYLDLEDSYRWRVAADGLHLDFRDTTDVMIHGVPSEAYSHAYFSQPIPAADCTPDDFDACLP